MSQQINLFNPIFLKQKKFFGAVPMLQALGVVLAGALAIAYYGKIQVAALEAKAAASAAQLLQKQLRQASVNAQFAQRQKNQVLEADIEQAERVLTAQRGVSATLLRGEFGNTRGYSEYFRAFARQRVEGLWLTGISINGAGNDIGLRGRALQPAMVPAYIGRLGKESALRGKSFSTLMIGQALAAAPVAPLDKVVGARAAAAPFVEFSLQSNPPESTDALEAGRQ